MALPCCTTEGKLLSCWKLKCLCARSEVVITPPCHGGDRRFKSGRARHEIIKEDHPWSSFVVGRDTSNYSHQLTGAHYLTIL